MVQVQTSFPCTVYNRITSKEKLKTVNPKNFDLEEDFLEYLASTDKSEETIKQYRANLRIFWCWNAEYFRPEYTICNGALYKTPEKVKTKGRGADGKMLELYTLVTPFNPYLKLWLDERHRLNIGSQWLFPRRRNGEWVDEPIPITTLNSWARSFSEILGVPFYWHALRHYFTTKLVSYDIPSSVIQDVIGWDSADMVNRYDDTDKDERFEKYFGADGIKKVRVAKLEEL